MKKKLYKFFFLDDRTNIMSSSKFVRIASWLLGTFYVLVGMWFAYSGMEINDNAIKLIDNIKDFLLFLIPTTEASYQFNRNNKMKNGGAPLVEAESLDEDGNGVPDAEQTQRKRIDL